MSGGTVSISRGLWDDTAFRNEPFTEREAWIWMIADAAWKAHTRGIGDLSVQLERGQLAGSVRYLGDQWRWSKSAVHRFLEKLKKRDMIRTETGTGILVITLCKYDEYQPAEKASGTRAGQRAGQHRDSTGTKEKKGEIREEEGSFGAPDGADEKPASPKRATRLPADWRLPKAWGEWAVAQGLDAATVRRQGERFHDYWIGKAGRDAAKADWEATWRNWIRKVQDDRPGMPRLSVVGGSTVLANGSKGYMSPMGWISED